MATGWDGTKGVLDGSVGWGTIDKALPPPPAGVTQFAAFLKMGFNTVAANSEVADLSLSWPPGHYWGFMFGDGALPTGASLASSLYDKFVGVMMAEANASANAALISAEDDDPVKQDYATAFSTATYADEGQFLKGNPPEGTPWSLLATTRSSGSGLDDDEMILALPRDPSVNGTLVLNFVATGDWAVNCEAWLCPENIDFSTIDFVNLDLGNIASLFPNSNGWYKSMVIHSSTNTSTANATWRPSAGVFVPPDRFVARYPVGAQAMEIYNVAVSYGAP